MACIGEILILVRGAAADPTPAQLFGDTTRRNTRLCRSSQMNTAFTTDFMTPFNVMANERETDPSVYPLRRERRRRERYFTFQIVSRNTAILFRQIIILWD